MDDFGAGEGGGEEAEYFRIVFGNAMPFYDEMGKEDGDGREDDTGGQAAVAHCDQLEQFAGEVFGSQGGYWEGWRSKITSVL